MRVLALLVPEDHRIMEEVALGPHQLVEKTIRQQHINVGICLVVTEETRGGTCQRHKFRENYHLNGTMMINSKTKNPPWCRPHSTPKQPLGKHHQMLDLRGIPVLGKTDLEHELLVAITDFKIVFLTAQPTRPKPSETPLGRHHLVFLFHSFN